MIEQRHRDYQGKDYNQPTKQIDQEYDKVAIEMHLDEKHRQQPLSYCYQNY